MRTGLLVVVCLTVPALWTHPLRAEGPVELSQGPRERLKMAEDEAAIARQQFIELQSCLESLFRGRPAWKSADRALQGATAQYNRACEEVLGALRQKAAHQSLIAAKLRAEKWYDTMRARGVAPANQMRQALEAAAKADAQIKAEEAKALAADARVQRARIKLQRAKNAMEPLREQCRAFLAADEGWQLARKDLARKEALAQQIRAELIREFDRQTDTRIVGRALPSPKPVAKSTALPGDRPPALEAAPAPKPRARG